MWPRDDMVRAAIKAQRTAQDDGCHSSVVLFNIAVDVVARMAIENAASIAEKHGDPQVEDAINQLKDHHSLG